jgi:hypothetical protein
MKLWASMTLFLVLTTSADAEPSWFVRHKRVITVIAVNGAALGINAAGLKHCRQGDVENCTAHYGSAWGTYGAWAGVTGVFVVMGEVTHKSNPVLGNFLSFTPPAYNGAWGINEWHQYAPEKDSTSSLKINPLWIGKLRGQP